MSGAVWAGPMPEVYDEHLAPALFQPFADDLARRAGALAPDRVLELAAGTGVVTRALLAALPRADVLATDLNEAMVAHGARRAPGATWQQADATALPLPDASRDLVVCSFGVMFFPDRPAAAGEARRVLRPGGTLLVTTWDVVAASAFPAALVDSLAEVLPDDPPDFLVRTPHGYADPGTARRDVEAGGLVVTGLERLVLAGRAESAAALAEGYCLGTPLRFELERRGDLRALADAVARAMTVRLGEGPVTGDLAALLVTATRP